MLPAATEAAELVPFAAVGKLVGAAFPAVPVVVLVAFVIAAMMMAVGYFLQIHRELSFVQMSWNSAHSSISAPAAKTPAMLVTVLLLLSSNHSAHIKVCD